MEIERLHLQPPPVERFADHEPVVRVRSTSTIEIRSIPSSVPSRLIGQQLTAHLRHDRLDLFLRSEFVEPLPRLHRRADESGALRRIDFRLVLDNLRRNPRALLRAQLQVDILRSKGWRQLLAALTPNEAANGMVDALHVVARDNDLAGVERYLRRKIRRGELNLSALRDHHDLRPPRGLAVLPQLEIPEHTLSSYDELLSGAPSRAGAGGGPPDLAQAVETGAVPQPVAGGRRADSNQRLGASQLPLRAGGAGAPATTPGATATTVA